MGRNRDDTTSPQDGGDSMSESGHPGGHPGGGHPGGRPGGHPGGHPGFERQYAEGTAPWDIGRPQPEIVALDAVGIFGHVVLDVGCGTGENTLYLASRGHAVHGIDGAPSAIERAREKAAERGLDADFQVADVIEALAELDFVPDAVIDVGFFHALDDAGRVAFASGLAAALAPGGIYAMLCFSDRVPGAFGPRRVSEAEIRETFSAGAFVVREVRPAELHAAVPHMPVVDANLALIERA